MLILKTSRDPSMKLRFEVLKRDVLEYPIDNLLDISGWDIRKSLKLFRKMTPALLEWINSPKELEKELGKRFL